MTDPARALAETVLQALGRNPMDFGGYIAGERLGKTECINAMLPALTAALDAVRREGKQEGIQETWEAAAKACELLYDASSDREAVFYEALLCAAHECRQQGGGG